MVRLGVAVFMALLVALASVFGAFDTLDEELYGRFLRQRNQGLSGADLGEIGQDLILVAIDAATVSTWGATLPPDVWGEIVRRLDRAGVTTIALNNVFAEEPPEPLAADLRASMANPKVVLQYTLDARQGKVVQVLPGKTLVKGWKPADRDARLGFTAVPGAAGQLRAVWLRITQGKEVLYAWPAVVLAHHLQTTPAKVLDGVEAAEHATRVNAEAPVGALEAWPNFPAPGLDSAHNLDNLLAELSLKQLLDLPEEQLPTLFGPPRRRIAIVGPVESGSAHMFTTLTGRLSGPQIQAVTVVNLVKNNFLLPETVAEELLFILSAGLLVGGLGARWGWKAGAAAALLGAPGLVLFSYRSVATFGPGRLLPVAGPILTLVLSSAALLALERLTASRRRYHRVLEAFRRFSPCGPLEGKPVLMWVDLRGLIACADDLGPAWTHVADFAGEFASILERFGGRLVDTSHGLLVVAFGLEPRSERQPAAAACGAGAAILADFKLRSPQWADAGPRAQHLRLHAGGRFPTRTLPRRALMISEQVLIDAEEFLRYEVAGTGYLVNVDETLTRVKLQGSWHPDLQQVPQTNAVRIGDVLGPYRIDGFIGQGGMGSVFLGMDTRLLRKVAVKVLQGDLDVSDAERFLAEARAVARVQHPGIVAIYDIEATPVLYLAMEFAPGQTLRELIENEAPLPLARAVALTRQILQALAAVHDHRIVHRDLKPANIMVDTQDRIKLMDFGLARFLEDDRRLTRMGDICGTPEYMAPEHLDDSFGEVDEVTDLFAVGTIVYEMLTGALPVRASSVAAIMHDLLHLEPEDLTHLNPEVSPAVEAVIRKALRKKKAERYQSAREFLDSLT